MESVGKHAKNPSKEIRVLGKRPTEEQKKTLLSFLEENLEVGRNQFQGSDGHGNLTQKWIEVSQILNKMGPAEKNGSAWKKFWEDWKNRVKKKYAVIKKKQNQSGVNGNFLEFLDHNEQKMVDIITIDVFDGDGKTRELGDPFGAPIPIEESSTGSTSTSSLVPSGSSENNPDDVMSTSSSITTSSETSQSAHQSNSSLPQRNRKRKKHLDDEMELLQSIAGLEEKKCNIDTERNEREKQAEQRLNEEHQMKMEVLKTKLQVMRQQIRD